MPLQYPDNIVAGRSIGTEILKFNMTIIWSRRIDLKHHIVYQIIDEDILIYSCRFHKE
jgi:Txe/YoeB family toxin of Txe-Axe toxin-antitoxin module